MKKRRAKRCNNVFGRGCTSKSKVNKMKMNWQGYIVARDFFRDLIRLIWKSNAGEDVWDNTFFITLQPGGDYHFIHVPWSKQIWGGCGAKKEAKILKNGTSKHQKLPFICCCTIHIHSSEIGVVGLNCLLVNKWNVFFILSYTLNF